MRSPASVVYIGRGEQETVYVAPYDYLYYKEHARVSEVRCIDELPGYADSFVEPLARLLLGAGLEPHVPAAFPAWLFARLSAAGVSLHVDEYAFLGELLHKGSDDLAAMRLVAAGVAMCLAAVRDDLARCRIEGHRLVLDGKPLDTDAVARRARTFLAERDIICDYALVACGSSGFHAHPGTTDMLQAHETIIVDLAARGATSGFYADASRTWCRGRPRARSLKDYYAVVHATKAEVEARMATDSSVAEIHRLTVDLLEAQGVRCMPDSSELRAVSGPVLHHALGHGVGRCLHEPPVFSAVADVPLSDGMVFAFEPGCYVRGEGGIRLEDTLEMTCNGARSLTGTPAWEWVL